MTRETFTIAAVAFVCSAAGETSPPVSLSHLANVVTLTARGAFEFKDW
jgi:hypothetical protein